jgi:hypothetical protein
MTPTPQPRPALYRGDSVFVREPGRTPWTGTVLSVKPSVDCWRVEVWNDQRIAYSVPSDYVHKMERGDNRR